MKDEDLSKKVEEVDLIGSIGQPLSSSIGSEMCWPSCETCATGSVNGCTSCSSGIVS